MTTRLTVLVIRSSLFSCRPLSVSVSTLFVCHSIRPILSEMFGVWTRTREQQSVLGSAICCLSPVLFPKRPICVRSEPFWRKLRFVVTDGTLRRFVGEREKAPKEGRKGCQFPGGISNQSYNSCTRPDGKDNFFFIYFAQCKPTDKCHFWHLTTWPKELSGKLLSGERTDFDF